MEQGIKEGQAKAVKAAANKLPTVVFSKSETPGIAKNIEKAIKNGAPQVLTRETSKSAIRKNRRNALRGVKSPGKGKSRDEYPFASSKEGGKGSCVAVVCSSEQNIQGVKMSSFYQKHNLKNGDKFKVKVKD